MNANLTIDRPEHARETGRRSDPLRPDRGRRTTPDGSPCGPLPAGGVVAPAELSAGGILPAAARRQRAQLPAYSPLLEEIELAGWSSHRRVLSGNFHDWLLLDDGRVLVTVGRATGEQSCDQVDAALVAQAAWTAIRAHGRHTRDAGTLLSQVARTLWATPDAAAAVSAAVVLADAVGGRATVAVAGDCLAWRVRAATCERMLVRQPALGSEANFSYLGHPIELSLRERLVLVADNSVLRTDKMVAGIGDGFTCLDAETHRRMTAQDALAIVRQPYERLAETDPIAAASIAVVRRR